MLGVGLFIMLIDNISSLMSSDLIKKILTQISFFSHYKNFTLGTIDLADTIFFLSISALFVFLTVRVLDKKRWS